MSFSQILKEKKVNTQNNREINSEKIIVKKPEQKVENLNLANHTEGSWPSSKNVSQ